MDLSDLLLVLALGCAAVAVMAVVRIAGELEKRGVRTAAPKLGILLFRNLQRYRELTEEETGRVGPLYKAFVIPINAALALALLAWLAQALS